MRNAPAMTDDDHGSIVAEIVRGLDDEDLLSIPGVADFICRNYADDIAERFADRLLQAQEGAAEFMRGDGCG